MDDRQNVFYLHRGIECVKWFRSKLVKSPNKTAGTLGIKKKRLLKKENTLNPTRH